MDGGIFIYQIQFHWCYLFPSYYLGHVEKDPEMGATEKRFVWDGVLKEDVNMALLLGEGGHR